MSGRGISASLTVYFDGQFWVAYCECRDGETVSAARHVFGPEPSLPEVADFVAGSGWSRLRFLNIEDLDPQTSPSRGNPKRRQREAARIARAKPASTRSQEALKAAVEALKDESERAARTRRARTAEEQWQQRVAKRKQKRRGH